MYAARLKNSASMLSNDAASGWALAYPEFGSSVNPITTRGSDYAHYITASPPEFENPAAALHNKGFILAGFSFAPKVECKTQLSDLLTKE